MSTSKLRTQAIMAVEAIVEPTVGGWMARSAPGSVVLVAVVAATVEEAREKFQAEIRTWAALSELPDEERGGT